MMILDSDYDSAIRREQLAQQFAEQYKSDAIRFETERDAAIDSAEYYKSVHLSMQTEIDNLTAEVERLRNESARRYEPEWQAETPFCQMLDGMGDEVLP
jgi:hypothetical protein